MITLKNSQLLQIGTSLVSRRPSRPCKIFKRPENREDSSDFDDFLMKTIATTQTFFSDIFDSPKFSRQRKIFATSAPASERVNERTKKKEVRYRCLWVQTWFYVRYLYGRTSRRSKFQLPLGQNGCLGTPRHQLCREMYASHRRPNVI